VKDLRFISLRVKAFKSFADPVTFTFPTQPGLYFMTGTNMDDPRLGANGCGKSSLWDALTWVIYGVTARDLKATAVRSWSKAGSTEVELIFELDGTEHTLRRVWNPNLLQLDNQDITQERVIHLFGVSKASFMFTILFGQFGDSLFDLKPAERTALVTQVLDLNQWDHLSKRAGDAAKDYADEAARIELKLERSRGAAAEIDFAPIKAAMREWENDWHVRMAYLRDVAGNIQDELSYMHEAAMLAEDDLEHYQRQAAALHTGASEYLSAAVKQVVRLEGEMRQLTKERDGLEREGRRLREGPGTCSKCGQPLPKGDAEKLLAEITDDFQSVEVQIDEVAEALDSAKEDRARYGRLVKEEQAEDDDEKLKADRRVQMIDKAIRDLERAATRADAEYGRVGAEDNPHAATLAKARRRKRQLRSEQEQLSADLTNLRNEHGSYSFWVKGFKDIKLSLTSRAMAELEAATNAVIAQLGMGKWRVTFSMDRETASGTIQRGFHVTIENSEGKGGAHRWEAWSGGESQRLRIAGNLGLANLIHARTGILPSLEVWDEPSSHMNSEGVYDLLEMLEARAQAEGKVIYVVDHNTLNYGGFAGKVNLVKLEGTTSLDIT
jgi:DNA repair exonuclease SbcCD ATPase subunit